MTRAFTIGILLVGLAGSIHAQGSQSGVLAGHVTDEDGGPLPGITVTATSPALMGERAAQTTITGDYVIRSLPPGSYKIVFELDGMATVERDATVVLGLTSRVDATMGLAAVEERIEVIAEAIAVFDNTQIGANLTDEIVDALPIGRTPVEIASLAPGLSNNAPRQGQLTISGAFGYDSAFLVDGVDINDPVYGSPVVDGLPIDQGLYIEDAIEETQVLTAAVSAEYGRFTGGVVNAITKSGGNRFRGSLRADLSDPAWRDETPLETSLGVSRDSNRNEVLSATLGGPILENRLWFFVAIRDNETSDSFVLPITNAEAPNEFDDRRWEAKLSANFDDQHTVRVTALDSDTSLTAPVIVTAIDPRTVMTQQFPGDLLAADYSGLLGPNVLIEARYSEKNQSIVKGGSSRDLPDSPFRTLSGPTRHYNAPPWDASEPEIRDNEQLAASVSWFLSSARAGSHDLKIGLEDYTSTRGGSINASATDHLFLANFLTDVEGRPILDAQGRLQPIIDPFAVIDVSFFYLRGGKRDIQTRSIYVNDVWRLNDRWSFNLGFRYEDIEGRDSAGETPVNTDGYVPRLAAAFDPRGDGRLELGVSYAEYSGGYNQSFYHGRSIVAQPGFNLGIYAGPPGVGIDFAPLFDLANYLPIGGSFVHGGLNAGVSTPISAETTLSAALRIGDEGWVEAAYVERSLEDMPTSFTSVDLGTTTYDLPNGTTQVLDNEIYRNVDLARREYEAIQVQGRYRPRENWRVEGNWTYQLSNDGNYEGESHSFAALGPRMGAYPELASAERNFPDGRLDDYQKHRVRAWTTWSQELGRAGDLDLALLFSYDSPRTFSLAARGVGFSDIQLARNPGYASLPHGQDVFFGKRGSGDFNESYTFDLAAIYHIPAGDRFEPWIKLDVRNVFNSKKLVSWDTTVFPDREAPVDADGLPTRYVEGPTFGQALSSADFVTPREVRVAVGVRF